jgi:hypothetical protein
MDEHPYSESSLNTWLDARALPDETRAAAYAALSGVELAVLKKCIAVLHRFWGERPRRLMTPCAFSPQLHTELDDRPAPWALVVCDAAYVSPAALLAAVMPAVLAGVDLVLPCLVRAEDDLAPLFLSPLLAALELAGLERAFSFSPLDAAVLLELLADEGGDGRLVLLGQGSYSANLAALAFELGVVSRFLTRPPRYFNKRLYMTAEQRFDDTAADGSIDGDDPRDIVLHLDTRYENIWIWPDLGPDWFRTRRLRVYE